MTLRSSYSCLAAICVGMILISTGCAETAHVIKDNSVNVHSYKTYAWVQKTAPKDGKPNQNNELVEQNIRNAVAEQLQKRGYVETTTDPELYISTDMLIERNNERRTDAVYTDSYYRNYYNPRTGRMVTYYFPSQLAGYENYSVTVRKGTVTVTFIDAKTDKAVWQGWASKRLESSTMDQDEIFQDVRSIFNKFDGN